MLARKGPSSPDKQKRFTGVAVSCESTYRNCSFLPLTRQPFLSRWRKGLSMADGFVLWPKLEMECVKNASNACGGRVGGLVVGVIDMMSTYIF